MPRPSLKSSDCSGSTHWTRPAGDPYLRCGVLGEEDTIVFVTRDRRKHKLDRFFLTYSAIYCVWIVLKNILKLGSQSGFWLPPVKNKLDNIHKLDRFFLTYSAIYCVWIALKNILKLGSQSGFWLPPVKNV